MSTATASSAKACLRLVVKTANHQCSDLNVDCDCNCNVRDLKLQLAKLHPITPVSSSKQNDHVTTWIRDGRCRLFVASEPAAFSLCRETSC